MTDTPLNIKSHAIQMMLEPSGLTNAEGNIVQGLKLRDIQTGVSIELPPAAFPWIKPGTLALVTLAITQITVTPPVEETPRLILPN